MGQTTDKVLSPPPRIVRDEYPEDGWLRGYFYLDEESANKPVGQRKGRAWKNVDYMRLRDVALLLLNPKAGERILDLGCADGATMVYCGLQGAAMYGIDLDADYIAQANARLRRFAIEGEAKCADAVEPVFPPDYFDAAISSDFFEHITPEVKVAVLRNVYKMLKPGRPLVIKTPNFTYLRLSVLYKRTRAVLRFQNPSTIVIAHTPGTEDPQHIGLTTRWELSRLLQIAGFLNYSFYHAPLRRFGYSPLMEVLSTEIPVIRDWLAEDLICVAHKPITLSHFPD